MNTKLSHIVLFKELLLQLRKETELHNRAVLTNPWFSHFYIQKAIDAVLPWFEREILEQFISGYKGFPVHSKNVGIIMAGNLPLVGFHDLVITLLSGHRPLVKLSHKDHVLMNWLIQQWNKRSSDVKIEIGLGERLDFVVATGSDNSSRYFEYEYRKHKKLIRKNRFSIAVLEGDESEEELNLLAGDIFMYDGLGCRNVSHVFIPKRYKTESLLNRLSAYPMENFSAAYRESLKYEKAKNMVLQNADWEVGQVLIKRSNQAQAIRPGWLNIIEYKDRTHLEQDLSGLKDKVQCVVGRNREISFGETQNPQLDQFADNIDLMKILLDL